MDQVCKTDQSSDQQPWHTPATRTVKQNWSEPQALTTGWGEYLSLCVVLLSDPDQKGQRCTLDSKITDESPTLKVYASCAHNFFTSLPFS